MLVSKKREQVKQFIILSVVFFIAHGFILIATGRWYDDWLSYNVDPKAYAKFMVGLGKIDAFWVGYTGINETLSRIVVFSIYYASVFFVYAFCIRAIECSNKDAFCISLLYIVLPINDARILYGCIPYALGMLLFLMASSVLFKDWSVLSLKRRVIAVALFMLSFTYNVNLCLYIVVLAIIVYRNGRDFHKNIQFVDFMLYPIIFFAIKMIVFKVSIEYLNIHAYEHYNEITVDRLIKAAKNIWFSPFWSVVSMINGFSDFMNVVVVRIGFILCVMIILLYVIKKILFSKNIRMESTINHSSGQVDLDKIWLGVLAIYASLFPYVVVRESSHISTLGWSGRDSITLSFGFSILMYGIIQSMINTKYVRYVMLYLCISGIVFFNFRYLLFQEDAYWQAGFRYQLGCHEELREASNIILLDEFNSHEVNTFIYYHNTAGNAELVFGSQDKAIIYGFKELESNVCEREDWYLNKVGHMNEYDYNNMGVDAIVKYKFNAATGEVFKAKISELFSPQVFEKWIRDNSEMIVVLPGNDEYKMLYNQEVDNICV